MKFKSCKTIFRKILWERIEARQLTGLRLPRQTGFEQAHISNFRPHRFDPTDAIVMSPRLTAGATLVIDRHYNSLKPYRKGEFNMYAVLKNDTCALRYIELAGSHPILRPRNQSDAAEVIPIPESQTASGFLVGRISHVSQE